MYKLLHYIQCFHFNLIASNCFCNFKKSIKFLSLNILYLVFEVLLNLTQGQNRCIMIGCFARAWHWLTSRPPKDAHSHTRVLRRMQPLNFRHTHCNHYWGLRSDACAVTCSSTECSGSLAEVSRIFGSRPNWKTAIGETRRESAALWLSSSGFWRKEA